MVNVKIQNGGQGISLSVRVAERMEKKARCVETQPTSGPVSTNRPAAFARLSLSDRWLSLSHLLLHARPPFETLTWHSTSLQMNKLAVDMAISANSGASVLFFWLIVIVDDHL